MTRNAMRHYTTADVLNTPIAHGRVLPFTEYADRSEFDPANSGLTGTIWNAMKSPMRAYRGEMSEDQMIPEALGMAGLMAGGSAFAPRPQNALTAFGLKPPRNGFELDYFGSPVQIVRNPSQAQLPGLLGRTKYKAVRRIVDPDSGDVYIWDAADPALHQMVAEKLGIKFDPNRADIIGAD